MAGGDHSNTCINANSSRHLLNIITQFQYTLAPARGVGIVSGERRWIITGAIVHSASNHPDRNNLNHDPFVRPGFHTLLVILVRASDGKKGNDRQHTKIYQDLVKYSYSYHSREQIYAENLVSIMAMLSSTHFALFWALHHLPSTNFLYHDYANWLGFKIFEWVQYGTSLHVHHMILTSCLSQLFLTLLF